MKQHFLKLLGYDRYANLLMLESIFKADQPAKAVQLMAHLLSAQQVWYSRAVEDGAPMQELWPDQQAVQFNYLIEVNFEKWSNFLNGPMGTDLSRKVSYANSKGDHFSTSLEDILSHMLNHGTHHRAQIGQVLKQSGLTKLPVTDLIYYLRSKDQ
ncbi:hypothetical protein LLH06_09085 [Mucilaginibacter daejeonensis]|uniref:DinB family protein n=1 Tax=Mucilaginibacter daejeonensis TaxID=398049 RepID=UPI001D170646|nr:DinB family protein [Mucilaginibacter daejeonensis]UEG55115.1 hypothetical protein LLH06_09085 [Mucilaginibacter daejeonensis]